MAGEVVNKVIVGGVTKLDISDTTAVPADVASGKKFYLANGKPATGTASASEWQISEGTQSDIESFYLECKFNESFDSASAWIIYSIKTHSNPSNGDIAAIIFNGDDLIVYAYRNGNAVEEINQFNGNINISPISGGTAFFIEEFDNDYHFSGGANSYGMIAIHSGSGVLQFRTSSCQPASGQTSGTFSVDDEPIIYFCGLETSVAANQYHRVQTVVKYDEIFIGTNFYTNTLGYYTDFTESYNNGSLTISSSGTNNGGYFHNPGTYTLFYLLEEDLGGGNYQTKTVTPTAAGLNVTADAGYDGLKKVIVEGDEDLVAGNIKAGVSIFNILGTYSAGGGASIDTKTLTNNDNTATSISFSSMKGQPIAFFVRATSQMSSSSTTYYYVTDMRYNGTNTTGNVFRMGSTRRVDNVTSGYSFSYSGTTLTISSNGSRTSSPGSFFNGGYELVYIY